MCSLTFPSYSLIWTTTPLLGNSGKQLCSSVSSVTSQVVEGYFSSRHPGKMEWPDKNFFFMLVVFIQKFGVIALNISIYVIALKETASIKIKTTTNKQKENGDVCNIVISCNACTRIYAEGCDV